MWQWVGERDAEQRSPYIPHNSNYYSELLHYSPLQLDINHKNKNCRARELERICYFNLHPVPSTCSCKESAKLSLPPAFKPLVQWLVRESHRRGWDRAGSVAVCEDLPTKALPEPPLGPGVCHSTCLYELITNFATLLRTSDIKNIHIKKYISEENNQ